MTDTIPSIDAKEFESVRNFFKVLFGPNRLVSQELREYYNRKKARAIAFLKKQFELEDQDFSAITIGSGRAIPAENSDVDLLFILNDQTIESEKLDYIKSLGQIFQTPEGDNIELDRVLTKSDLEDSIFPLLSKPNLAATAASDIYANILLTPDILIEGSIELVVSLRKSLLLKAGEVIDAYTFWNDIVWSYFYKRIKGWHDDRQVKGGTEEKLSRGQRYNDGIVNVMAGLSDKYRQKYGYRGGHIDISMKWYKKFRKLFEDLELPDWNEYRAYLEENGHKIPDPISQTIV